MHPSIVTQEHDAVKVFHELASVEAFAATAASFARLTVLKSRSRAGSAELRP
ncbi:MULTISPECIES: hypothetical protein [unclassified Curtobacterium]|uniref:hypothetical protein n=1 Tax=unclassified Curtobacterium TaxID=257496 RepID=UPI0015E8C67D|nr:MULTISPECIES: hypothetical protein [unclassified Curtobacterium]WIB13457.1 hypothetical protein DEJ36_06590 [Curtobacterium sp. MCPF17_052]